MVGVIGWSWWSEGTRIFSNVSNVQSSPVNSWPWHPSLERVTDASLIEQEFTNQRALRLQNSVDSEERILRALNETRESTSAILRKLEEIRQIRVGTSSVYSALDPSLMTPQTPSSVGTAVETAGLISRNTEAMLTGAGFIIDSMGNFS